MRAKLSDGFITVHGKDNLIEFAGRVNAFIQEYGKDIYAVLEERKEATFPDEKQLKLQFPEE